MVVSSWQGNFIVRSPLFPALLAATSLLACGRPEEAAPRAALPAAEAQPTPVDRTRSETSPAARPDLAHGQQVYRQSCAFCHDKGIMGAPRIGDVGAWSPRLAQGVDALYASALHGKGAMPAKGGNPSLADGDARSAVDFLAAQAR